MSAVRHTFLVPALMIACATHAGCTRSKDETRPAPHALPASTAETGTGSEARVRVAPDLIANGRIHTSALDYAMPHSASDSRTVAGEVISDEQGRAEVGALTQGRIVSLEAGVGTQVRKGQILAWLEAPEVARVAADLLRARARSDVATRKEQRQLELAAGKATSQNAVDDARAEARIAQADVAALGSLLRSLGGAEPKDGTALLSRIALRSPSDGTVSACHAPQGAALSPDKSLFEIVITGHRLVLARWPEAAMAPPAPGARTRLHARGAETAAVCDGHVRGDVGVVDPASRTRTVRIEPDANCTQLTPGTFVDVEVADQSAAQPLAHGAPTGAPRLLLSRDAIVEVRGVSGVFVADGAAGDFVFRAVKHVPANASQFQILAGLKPGDIVVDTGAPLLKGELLREDQAP